MGEYVGTFQPANPPPPARPDAKAAEDALKIVRAYTWTMSTSMKAEAKVWAVKGGYNVRLIATPPDPADKPWERVLAGKAAGARLAFGDAACSGSIEAHGLTADVRGEGRFDLKFHERRPPTLGAKPPAGAVVLLALEEGKAPSLEEWQNQTWVALSDGSIMKGAGDQVSKRTFGSGKFHVEFMTPYEPEESAQQRGNSGVYLHGKYEVQVLDSFGLVPGKGDCGAVYGVAPPRVNACLPPLAWQTYDITFTAPKVGPGGKVVEPARLTVLHNGILIQENQAVGATTRSGMAGPAGPVGPLMLQDHGHLVRFRNIWVVEAKD